MALGSAYGQQGDGFILHMTSGVPDNTLGVDDDMAIDHDDVTRSLYLKVAGAWVFDCRLHPGSALFGESLLQTSSQFLVAPSVGMFNNSFLHASSQFLAIPTVT